MIQFQNNEIINLPDITEITFTRIEKKYLKVILLSTFCYFLIISLLFFVFIEKVITKKMPEYTGVFYFVFILFIISVFILLIIGFPKRKFAIRDKDISYKSGVFIEKMVTVPFSRIQHIEIEEGIFSRLFKLATISVFTAGDSSDDLEIKGITKEKALQIKEFISQKING